MRVLGWAILYGAGVLSGLAVAAEQARRAGCPSVGACRDLWQEGAGEQQARSEGAGRPQGGGA